MNNSLITKVFIGLILGAALFVGYTYWESHQPSNPPISTVGLGNPDLESKILPSNLTGPIDRPKPTSQTPAIMRTVMQLSDITVNDNDKRGAFFEIGDSDGTDLVKTRDQFGIYLDQKYDTDDGSTVKLKKVNAGYTLSSEWTTFELNNRAYTLKISEKLIYQTDTGKVALRLLDILLPEDNYKAYFEIVNKSGVVIDRKILSNNQKTTVGGQDYTLLDIYPGLTLNAKSVRIESSDKISIMSVSQELVGGSMNIRLVDILPNNIADALEKNNQLTISQAWQKVPLTRDEKSGRKVLMEKYSYQTKELIDSFTLSSGESIRFGLDGLDSIKLDSYDVDITGANSYADFSVYGPSYPYRTYNVKAGQSFRMGAYYFRLADISMAPGQKYGSFDYTVDDQVDHQQRKTGDQIVLPKGVLGKVIDVEPGYTLNKKYVKIQIDDIIKTMSIGEFMCPNLEITSNVGDCDNPDYKSEKAYMTNEMLTNVVS